MAIIHPSILPSFLLIWVICSLAAQKAEQPRFLFSFLHYLPPHTPGGSQGTSRPAGGPTEYMAQFHRAAKPTVCPSPRRIWMFSSSCTRNGWKKSGLCFSRQEFHVWTQSHQTESQSRMRHLCRCVRACDVLVWRMDISGKWLQQRKMSQLS